ncbi:hypothetical protein F7725_002133 [Dissostichus mawsoni]|uniref:Uncharacterized protein n=1 Tax=Dissostichus mawsoni TaxID=36200 RepID=A0A7J5Y1I7_DISMA|nr:hypothetical protein F7725_002133 [Dissostichus mawsoni]
MEASLAPVHWSSAGASGGPCAPVESADYPDLTTPIRSQDFQSGLVRQHRLCGESEGRGGSRHCAPRDGVSAGQQKENGCVMAQGLLGATDRSSSPPACWNAKTSRQGQHRSQNTSEERGEAKRSFDARCKHEPLIVIIRMRPLSQLENRLQTDSVQAGSSGPGGLCSVSGAPEDLGRQESSLCKTVEAEKINLHRVPGADW